MMSKAVFQGSTVRRQHRRDSGIIDAAVPEYSVMLPAVRSASSRPIANWVAKRTPADWATECLPSARPISTHRWA